MRDLAGTSHLSDEAIAAFADDVLAGSARERARRHTARCAECNSAVALQREAIWALRAAPAPSLPGGLLDRLRDVPVTTPIRQVPSTVDETGTAMFATFAAPVAAFAPTARPSTSRPSSAKVRPRTYTLALAAASLAVVGTLAGAAVVNDHSDPANQTSAQFLNAPIPGTAVHGR